MIPLNDILLSSSNEYPTIQEILAKTVATVDKIVDKHPEVFLDRNSEFPALLKRIQERQGRHDNQEPHRYDKNDDSLSNLSSSRVVRFCSTDRYVTTFGLCDYSKAEMKRCWYTEEEIEQAAEERKQVIKRMESGKPEKDSSMTYRGLENWTKEGGMKQNDTVLMCIDSVLDEQELQWALRKQDLDRIAAASQRISIRSIWNSVDVASNDRKEIMEEKPRKKSVLGNIGRRFYRGERTREPQKNEVAPKSSQRSTSPSSASTGNDAAINVSCGSISQSQVGTTKPQRL